MSITSSHNLHYNILKVNKQQKNTKKFTYSRSGYKLFCQKNKKIFKKGLDSLLKVKYYNVSGGEKMKRTKLIEFRKENKLTQEGMARKLDITLAHYQAVEYGYRNPSLELLQNIKDKFPRFSVDKIFLM